MVLYVLFVLWRWAILAMWSVVVFRNAISGIWPYYGLSCGMLLICVLGEGNSLTKLVVASDEVVVVEQVNVWHLLTVIATTGLMVVRLYMRFV